MEVDNRPPNLSEFGGKYLNFDHSKLLFRYDFPTFLDKFNTHPYGKWCFFPNFEQNHPYFSIRRVGRSALQNLLSGNSFPSTHFLKMFLAPSPFSPPGGSGNGEDTKEK